MSTWWFPLCGYYECCLQSCLQVLCGQFSFLLDIYLGMKMLGGMETVWVLRNCQATFHSGYKGDSAFSTPSRACYLSFTIAILVDGKWCFTVGLICSSPAILSSTFMVPMVIFSGETATRFLCLFPKLNNFCLFVMRVLHIYRFLSGRWFINIFSYSVGLSPLPARKALRYKATSPVYFLDTVLGNKNIWARGTTAQ